MTTPLYRRVLGARFDALPPKVRALHDLSRPCTWRGEADVERAVAAARRAFEGAWSTMRPAERGQILFRVAELLIKHGAEIADATQEVLIARAASHASW